jgi:Cytochrome P460
MLNRILPVIALFVAIAFALQASAQSPGFAQPAPASSANVPKYSDKNLLFPDGFRSWMFVGSNVGLLYKGDAHPGPITFHNIYINPEAFAHFRDTGQFPDPTMLVMDIYDSKDREDVNNIITRGSFNGPWDGNFVAVKDSKRPPGPNGETSIWAYYIFSPDKTDSTKPQASAAAEPDKFCYGCHKEHGMIDNVWVQLYPMLRSLVKAPPK